ncbi:acetyltransferase [Roseivirga sp. BDSF3-8]|uniref:acetyltransferase n=1 Tax=Roseivirga sp. BDSF3-8 TaxID=3241598 RepID=UPI00353205A1
MDNPVIIIGAKGIAKPAMEIFKSNGVLIYCFLDDDESLHGKEIDDVAILGRTDDDGYLKLIGKKCEAFVATDDNAVRKSLTEMVNKRRKKQAVNAVHQATAIAPSASIGHGNFINAGITVGAFSKVGNHCILHSHSTIDFEASVGDFVQVGAGAVVGSGVEIGDEVFIGSGATIIPGVKVGKGARIGAGSVVIADVKAKQTVFGNPAKPVE